jgi:hypothetical protein
MYPFQSEVDFFQISEVFKYLFQFETQDQPPTVSNAQLKSTVVLLIATCSFDTGDNHAMLQTFKE